MLENDKWYGEKSIWEVEWEVRRVGGRQHAFLMGWMGKPFGKMALKGRLKGGVCNCGAGVLLVEGIVATKPHRWEQNCQFPGQEGHQ